MANTQQTSSAGGLFGPPVSGDAKSREVRRLKAELQVEKDRHRVLVQRAHTVEKNQSDRDSAAALALLEKLDDADSATPA